MTHKAFDAVGRFYTSVGAVILIFTLLISAMTTFSHTFFLESYPAHMTQGERQFATWIMAIVWECTVLLMIANAKYLGKNVPRNLGIASAIMILFFMHAFDFHKIVLNDWTTWLLMIQRWFIGCLFGWLNYSYAELFMAKWSERNNLKTMPIVDELSKALNESKSKVIELASTTNQLRSALNESESALVTTQSALVHANNKQVELERENSKLLKFQSAILQQLTCPHCQNIFDEFGALHAHKGHCIENPKKKERQLLTLKQ